MDPVQEVHKDGVQLRSRLRQIVVADRCEMFGTSLADATASGLLAAAHHVDLILRNRVGAAKTH